jgi:hypothetical protein
MTAAALEKLKPRANFSVLALISFILSFIVARAFSTFYPDIVLISGGLHIHHFWFGIVLLAVGGWLGISSSDPDVDRVAAIFYGVGGGLIGDEIGLLLTLENYETTLTFTFVTVLLAVVSILILLNRYRRVIADEFAEFLSNKASLYLGVFLAAVSVAFIAETDDSTITLVSAVLFVAAVIIVAAFVVKRSKNK